MDQPAGQLGVMALVPRMMSICGPGNVIMDTCEACEVHWLDRGELEGRFQQPIADPECSKRGAHVELGNFAEPAPRIDRRALVQREDADPVTIVLGQKSPNRIAPLEKLPDGACDLL